MIAILFLIFVVIAIGLFGSFFLFNISSIKKSTKKPVSSLINQTHINQLFIITLCLFGVALYFFKDYRTPSKDRLEKISDIRLPANFKVLHDEYQDMGQDYCIFYDIQFSRAAASELIKVIRSAKFYNPNVKPDSVLSDSLFIKSDKEKSMWCKSEEGYRFSRQDGLTTYSVKLDTLTNILKYSECAE